MLVVLVGLAVPAYFARENLRRDIVNETVVMASRDANTLGRLLHSSTRRRPLITLEQVKLLFEHFSDQYNTRVTYISDAGQVLVETGRDLINMGNHADREEVRQAIATGRGHSIRFSTTMDREYVYAAESVNSIPGLLPKGVVRVAMAYSGVEERLMVLMRQWLLVLSGATLLALALSYALAGRLEKSLRDMIRVVESIAVESTQDRRTLSAPDPEFVTLMAAVNDMADRIDDNIRTIAQQKAQLETILDTMDEGVLVVGSDNRISLVNKALQRLFPQVEEGRTPEQIFTLPDLVAALDTRGERPGDWIEVSALQLTPRANQVLSVHLARPRAPVHGISCVAVFHDISEMVRLHQMRRDFMANVSHELRTPLTVIQGTAETLLDLPTGDEMDEADEINRDRFLGIIMRHATHMTRMVEDLLHLARIESGSLPMKIEPLDAYTLVNTVMLHVLGNPGGAGPRSIRVECRLPTPEDGGLSIRADPHFLSQVFRNLLENAIRHTPDSGQIVITGVRWATRHGPEAVFAVSDNGPGFPEEDLHRVFERFYRVEKHRATIPGTPSTGLGLAICKHIVERHSGRIWAENAVGGTVRFTIPLHVGLPRAFSK